MFRTIFWGLAIAIAGSAAAADDATVGAASVYPGHFLQVSARSSDGLDAAGWINVSDDSVPGFFDYRARVRVTCMLTSGNTSTIGGEIADGSGVWAGAPLGSLIRGYLVRISDNRPPGLFPDTVRETFLFHPATLADCVAGLPPGDTPIMNGNYTVMDR